MTKRLVKTLKHGLTILFATTIEQYVPNWDNHLPHNLFGYCYDIQTNIKFFRHMILTNHIPRQFLKSIGERF
jgi:hypothetical protein